MRGEAARPWRNPDHTLHVVEARRVWSCPDCYREIMAAAGLPTYPTE
ncbi:hypothetical protein SEA_MARIOKART_63 [Gordonia phage Mariokart]|nr:hypothetical protein SEA_MARIOKART_63 [Gordonia phage Mariokart]